MKKASTELTAITAIILSILAISIIFVFWTGINSKKDDYYCKQINKISKTTTSVSTNPPNCKNRAFTFQRVEPVENTLTRFENNKESQILVFSSKGEKTIILPINPHSTIINANAMVNGKIEGFTTTFTEKRPPINLNFYMKQKYSYNIQIPKDVEITKAELQLVPNPYVDIIVLMDSSESMRQEWDYLCNKFVTPLNKTLRQKEYEPRIRFYAIGDNNGGKEYACANVWLDSKTLSLIKPAAFKIPEQQTGINQGPNTVTTARDQWAQTLNTFITNNPGLASLSLQEARSTSGSVDQELMPQYNTYLQSTQSYDDYDEAWALAAAWLLDPKNKEWNPDAIKILLVLSDSDPTGSKKIDYSLYIEEPKFVGSEEEAVANAKKYADTFEGTIILDEGKDPETQATLRELATNPPELREGYSLGTANCAETCNQIKTWKQSLIKSVNPQLIKYDDPELVNKITNEITQLGIKDTTITIQGNNLEIPPDYIGGISIDFKNLINTQNAGDDSSYITIPFVIERAQPQGFLTIKSIRIEYKGKVQNPTISIGNIDNKITVWTGELTPGIDATFDFTTPLKELYSKNKGNNFQTNLYFTIDSPGMLNISNLNIKYISCDVEETLMNFLLTCWEESNKGTSDKNYVCGEFVVPEKCGEAIYTEEMIAEQLKEHNYCTHLKDLNYGCGGENNIEWKNEITTPANILIEYKDNKLWVS